MKDEHPIGCDCQICNDKATYLKPKDHKRRDKRKKFRVFEEPKLNERTRRDTFRYK